MTSSPENIEVTTGSLARDSVGTTLTYGLLFFFGLLIFVLNCRILGPTWRGVLGLVMLAPGIILKVGNFGYEHGMVVLGGRDRNILGSLTRTGIDLGYILGVIAAGILLGFMNAFPIQFWRVFQGVWNPEAFTVIAVVFPVHLATLVADATIYAEDLIGIRNRKEIYVSAITLVATIVLCFGLGYRLMGVIGAYVIANLFSLGYGRWLVRDKFESSKINLSLIPQSIKLGFPVSMAFLASYLMLPVMMVMLALSLEGDAVTSLARIGFFSVAYMMVDRILPVTRSVAFALLPKITSGSDSEAGELAAKASRHTLMVSVLLFVFLVIFMKPIITILLGQRFLNVVVPFAIMAPGGIMLSVSGVWSANLLARKYPVPVAVAGITGVIIALICAGIGSWIAGDGREVLVASISVVLGNLVTFLIMLPAFCRSGRLTVKGALLPTLDDLREWKRIPGFIFDMIRSKRS